MEIEEFDALVARLEAYAASHAAAYKARVALLAILGYFYVVAVVLVAVLVIAGLVALALSSRLFLLAGKLALPAAALAWVSFRALWSSVRLRFPAPKGRELHAAEAPALFGAVEEIRRGMKAPPVHHILLTMEFNASVVQVPRLGILGWNENFLLLGLPLMQTLSPDQLKAVLAHELGHLSGAHSRFEGWVYRVRATWQHLGESLANASGSGSFVFNRFLNWYAPYFSAYSFVLARAHEYRADAHAGELFGPRCAVDALIRLEVAGAYFDEVIWPEIAGRAASAEEPPSDIYADIQRALLAGIEPERVERVLERSLARRTDSGDSHPSLADRIAALGVEARPPEAVRESAAEALLGRAYPRLVDEMSRAWREAVESEWRARHRSFQQAREGLEALGAKAAAGALAGEELLKYACWTEELKGSEAALPFYQAALRENPEEPGLSFAVGRILLSRGDAGGIDSVEAAMRKDLDYLMPGCEIVYGFLKERGRDDEARPYYKRAAEYARTLELAAAERSTLPFADVYLDHGLAGSQVAAMRGQLARHPEVAEAYLVRKRVEYLRNRPLFVLCISVRRPWYRYSSPGTDEPITARIAGGMEFPGETLVIPLSGDNAKMKRFLKKVPGSRIYPD
jgi:Zn-dependent protease with chaperone function